MDGLFAACGKLMQTFRKELSCFDVDSDAVEGETGGLVNSHLLDEI
jgi:hypothetical protein